MSIGMIEWAFAQEVEVPSAKLVLLALADHYNGKTDDCWPGIERLAQRTNLHRSTVIRALEVLTGQGLVQVLSQPGRVNHYQLAYEEPVADCDPTRRILRRDPSQIATLTVKNRNEPLPPKGRARATRLPDDWAPDAELIDWVRERYPALDWETSNDIFADHWRSSSGSTASKLDWRATWRNWMRRDAQRTGPSPYRNAHAARMDGKARTNAERIDRALARREHGEDHTGTGGPRLRLIAGGGGQPDG